MLGDGSAESLTKKEKLTLGRDRDKMEKVLGGISQLGRVPAALFIIDIGHEHIALAEAKRLGITTFGMVDTNCDPNKVDFAIPSNDDATKSISLVTGIIIKAIEEGLDERKREKEDEAEKEAAAAKAKLDTAKTEAPAAAGTPAEGGKRKRVAEVAAEAEAPAAPAPEKTEE